MGHMSGFGDPETWPDIGNPGDPRNDEPADEVDQAQELMGEIREQIDRAKAAVCRRDWQTYRIDILNVHDLSRSMLQ